MNLFRATLGTLLLMAVASPGRAEVVPYTKLSVSCQLALEESERRMVIYDHELEKLDQKRCKGRISKNNYQFEQQQLLLLIQQESLYQNAIMVHDPRLLQRAKDLAGTMEHVVLIVPMGIGYVIGKCPQLLELLALIH
jgi:hypothetical protein